MRLIMPPDQFEEQGTLPVYKEPLVFNSLLTGAPRRLFHTSHHCEIQHSESMDPVSFEVLDGSVAHDAHALRMDFNPK